MNRVRAIALMVSAGVIASCGGGSGSSGTTLQQADVDQLSASLADAFANASATQPSTLVGGAAQSIDAVLGDGAQRSGALTTSVAVNHATACPVDGHVTATGNVFAICPTPPATGSCNLSGAITFNFGDRTNNLNDCTYSNGLVVDGSLMVTLSGTASGGTVTLTETVTGSLELDRKGPTGGLVPIDVGGLSSCFVLLTAKLPERTITGSVCGQAVSRTF